MGPKGETIQAFEKIYAPAKTPQQTQQPAGQLPWKDHSVNLLDNDAWDALLSRLPAWYRPEARPEPRQDARSPADVKNAQDSEQPVQTPRASKAWLEKQESDRRFEDAYKMTRKAEGGFVNNPNDSGKETNFGVTKETLGDYHKNHNDPDIPKEVENLQPKHAEYILRKMYYDQNNIGGIVDPRLARHIFDMSVLPNPQTAARWVQKGINEINGNEALQIDGRLGPLTTKALNQLDEAQIQNLNRHLSEKREDFFIDLAERRPKDKKYLKGWVARARAYR